MTEPKRRPSQFDGPSDLDRQLAEARKDTGFMARIKRRVQKEDTAVLRRLARKD